MDRGSFRAGNDLRLYRPVSSSVKRATRDGSNDLQERQEIIYNAFFRDRSDSYVRISIYYEQMKRLLVHESLMTRRKKVFAILIRSAEMPYYGNISIMLRYVSLTDYYFNVTQWVDFSHLNLQLCDFVLNARFCFNIFRHVLNERASTYSRM